VCLGRGMSQKGNEKSYRLLLGKNERSEGRMQIMPLHSAAGGEGKRGKPTNRRKCVGYLRSVSGVPGKARRTHEGELAEGIATDTKSVPRGGGA